MPIDWKEALKYGELILIARTVNGGALGPIEIGQIKSLGYTFLQTIYGDDLATDIDPHLGDVVTFGFLAVSDAGELVAAIRGTDSIMEWLHDADFLMVPNPILGARGLTDDGFTSVYRSLRVGEANNSQRVKDSIESYLGNGSAKSATVCGHSLGGAVATLLALDIALNSPYGAPAVYTYASPRSGDHFFSDSYKASIVSSYRIENRMDVIPKLPPLPYEHVDLHCSLNPPILNSLDIVKNHLLTTYLAVIQCQTEPAAPTETACLRPSL